MGLPLVVYLPPFYSEMAALSTGLVGVILFFARIFDVLTDPVIGWASDHTSSSLGRRRPWMLVGTPVLMAGGWFLFVPPENASAWYLLSWSLVAYLGWTLIYLPYTTLGAELSADYDERSRITAFREGFFVLGTMVAIMLPAIVQQESNDASAGLSAIAYFILLSLPLAVLLFMWRVPEAQQKRSSGMNWREGARLIARNAPFRRLLMAYLFNGAANGLPAALFLFFVIHILGGDQITSGIYLGIYFLSAVGGLPLWLKLGSGWSKHRLWCASMLWASLIFMWAPFLGEGDFIAYGIICVLSGVCLGVDQAIPASIQADVIDEDTAAGGDQRAGLYFGLWGMATKMAFALAVGIAYPVLELAGFDAKIANDTQALWVLALLYGGLPVLVKLGVVALMWDFPLDRARHAQLQQQIGDAGA